MVTVQELIEALSKLPQDAFVEVLKATAHRHAWSEQIVVTEQPVDLETDIEYKDYRNVDPIKYPSFGGKQIVFIGQNDT